MKKILLTFSLIISCYAVTFAQSFSLQDTVENVSGTLCTTSAHGDFKVYNTGNTPDTLSWSRAFENNWPSAWTVATCDNNGCYSSSVVKMTFIVAPGDSATISMTISTNGVAGNGVISTNISKVGSSTSVKNRMKAVVTACTNIGINENKLSDIKFYPSPFQSNLNVQLNNNSAAKSIEFYNLIGSLVYKQEINSNDDFISVNASSLPKGLYFVSLLDANRKVILSKRVEKN
ncbi:MAG: Secretion system C-terminal sorting domain [Bacteroidota bacterium]|jgi:hypothetical protein